MWGILKTRDTNVPKSDALWMRRVLKQSTLITVAQASSLHQTKKHQFSFQEFFLQFLDHFCPPSDGKKEVELVYR